MMILQAGQTGLYRRDSIWTDSIPPDMVAGIVFWVDGTDTATLWSNTDFTGSNVSTDGAALGSVNSKITTTLGLASVNSVEIKTPAANGKSAIVVGDPTGFMSLRTASTTPPASTVFTASTKLILAVVKVTAAVAFGGTINNSDGIVSDSDRLFWGLHFYEVSGPTGDITAGAHNYSGGTQSVSVTFPRDEWVVVTMSHQSGRLRLRVNGGAWATISSGNSDYIGGSLHVGDSTFSTARRFEIAHIAIANTAQTDAAISAVERWMAGQLGVSL